MSEYTTRAEYDERQREIDDIAEELHQQYLLTAGRLGWPVKPECTVPYAQLSDDGKELDRVFARWHLAKVDALAAELATVKDERDHWKQEAVKSRRILRAILDADERGQGLPFKEALDAAQAVLKEAEDE